MNALNPVCKLIGIFVPTLILAAVHHPILNISVFVICLLLLLMSRVRVKLLLLLFLPIILASIGMFFTGYHFQVESGAPVNADNWQMTGSAVWNGLTLSSRVLVYAGLGLLFALTTNKIDLIRSLQQQLHLPSIFAYGILAAWNIFPNLMEEYRKTRLAFRARGVYTSPVSPTLLKPMLVKAVLWSNALSIAMESKGFNGSVKRTEFYVIRVGWKDLLFPVVTIGGMVVFVF
ncbi:energy-coupling factor transporter transmembrane protein EcfT [Paucisalibacillus sp. EB02]|uniref:energy-coupling factor transporter transmembrane component T family protein n=1 Tax=Paucisalibacillus sp. EB02 TaxID=1347087 RepID=UPI0004BC5E91|nr:energy-coupling factor transporter transmembrane component T [Paucisalibacillus sp. EB02]